MIPPALQLSNVEQGRYTVFTKLNLFLPPVKGALVMWHNLHRSLDVDVRTFHAGCPVIVGSKRSKYKGFRNCRTYFIFLAIFYISWKHMDALGLPGIPATL